MWLFSETLNFTKIKQIGCAMEKQVDFQGKKINYSVTGTGLPVVLLHGFLENLHIWDDLTGFLQAGFQVIAVDLPGFGKTPVFAENHTMPFMADAVKAVLEAEKVQQAVLVGHSMGGYISLAFAHRFPEMMKALVLFHSHAAGDDEQGKQNRTRTIEVVKKDHKDFIAQFIPLLFAEENVSKYSAEINRLREVSLETSKDGVIAAMAGMRDRDDHLTLLKNAGFPVFFVVGKQDSRIPTEKIMKQLALPEHAEAIILEHVGHMGFIEAPDKIFPVIKDFMERYR